MPLLTKKFAHDYSALTKYTPFTYKVKLANDTEGSNANGCKEIQEDFYPELKSMLKEINPDIVFDDSKYSFTVWGRTYYVYCYMFSNSSQSITTKVYSNGYFNVVAPMIYGKQSISSTRSFRWMFSSTSYLTQSGTTNICPGSGIQTNMWVDGLDRIRTSYTLKIYYNTNFLNIQYVSAKGELVNLITIIKGNIKSTDIDVIYESASPNNNYINNDDVSNMMSNKVSGTVYGTVPQPEITKNYNSGYHQIYRCDSGSNLVPTGNNAGNPGISHNFNIFGTNHIESTFGRSLVVEMSNASDALIFKPLCLGGCIEFENLLEGSCNLNLDQCYNIDGSIYYCTGDAVQMANEQNYQRELLYPRFLLKL